MKKSEAAKQLGIETFDFELAAMQAGIEENKEDFSEKEVEAIAQLLGIIFQSSEKLSGAIESGAITKAESQSIVASRLSSAGFSLSFEEIDYLYGATADSFRRLARGMAEVAILNFTDEIDSLRAELVNKTHESFKQSSQCISDLTQQYTPSAKAKIDFKKLREELK